VDEVHVVDGEDRRINIGEVVNYGISGEVLVVRSERVLVLIDAGDDIKPA